MSWLELLGNAGTGGLLGIGGSLATGWMKIKGLKAQAEIDIKKAELGLDKTTIEADAKDFQASQNTAAEEHKGLIALAKESTPGQKWILVLLHAFKGSVRPSLAYSIHIIAGIAYFSFSDEHQTMILGQIFTMAFAYGGWYYGQRDLNKRLFNK